MNDSTVSLLATLCPQLTHLDVSRCAAVTEASIIMLAQALPDLQVLKLQNTRTWRGDVCLSDDGLKIFGRCCGNLRALDVTQCHLITDDGLFELVDGCPFLEDLVFDDCDLLTDQALLKLSSRCSNLKRLSLMNCTNLTDEGLEHLAHALHQIEDLCVEGCSQITPKAMFAVYDSCPKLVFS